MPELQTAPASLPSTETRPDPKASPASDPSMDSRVSELRVSATLMKLDPGLYCIVLPRSPMANAKTDLPGLRITHAPGLVGRHDAVTVRTMSADGWMSGFGDAALVRVNGGPAQVLVTIYQAADAQPDDVPNLQVLPLIKGDTGHVPLPAITALPAPLPPPTVPTPRVPVDVVAHIQTRGDVGAVFGEWLGERGSGKWIEGFGIAPTNGVALSDIEYQVVLGRGWMSPWVEGGQYCGSRGMALPALGLRVRLRGAAAQAFELRYSASFVDGALIGPVAGGEPCESESLSAVEALMIEIAPIGTFGSTKTPGKQR